MADDHTRARRTEIALTYEANKRDAIAAKRDEKLGGCTPVQRAERIKNLESLFKHRYGSILPDDDAGRDDARIMARHLANLPGDTRENITGWLKVWAPWMPADELEGLIAAELANPDKPWRAGALGNMLNLTAAERTDLKITTIRPANTTKVQLDAARQERKRPRDRLRKEQQRRRRGARPRAQYEADSLRKTQPWKSEGISERTWYRRNRSGARGHAPAKRTGREGKHKTRQSSAITRGKSAEVGGQRSVAQHSYLLIC